MADQQDAAAALFDLASSRGAEPFRDEAGRLFVTMRVSSSAGAHDETHPLSSRAVRSWLQQVYHEATGRLPPRDAMTEVIEKFEAAARFEGTTQPVHVRTAEHDGALYLDLGDAEWRAVEITPGGWHVVRNPPVKFRRPRGLLPLPEPVGGGCVTDLAPFVNMQPDSDEFVLLVETLVGHLRGRGPFSILALEGEQGRGKSTLTRIVGRLLDPSACELRGEPHDVRDLMIAGNNGYVLRFDNISIIRPWLSDALCRVATGGGFATRELYSDDEETLINVTRPIVLNGITSTVTRPDLLDRSIVIRVPELPDAKRRPEADFWRDFEQAHPRILGALLDAAVVALRDESKTRLASLPRMADFARWAVAAERALPWPVGTFMRAYQANRRGAVVAMLDDDPVAEAVRQLLTAGTWTGSAGDLRKALHDRGVRLNDPRQATGALRRLAPALRHAGIEINFDAGHRHGNVRILAIYRASVTP